MFYVQPKLFFKKKPVYQVLSSVFGIGPKTGVFICNQCSILPKTPAKILSEKQWSFLLNWAEQNLSSDSYGQALLKYRKERRFFKAIEKSYVSTRVKSKLPCNGQRTKTNAKTAKKIKW